MQAHAVVALEKAPTPTPVCPLQFHAEARRPTVPEEVSGQLLLLLERVLGVAPRVVAAPVGVLRVADEGEERHNEPLERLLRAMRRTLANVVQPLEGGPEVEVEESG